MSSIMKHLPTSFSGKLQLKFFIAIFGQPNHPYVYIDSEQHDSGWFLFYFCQTPIRYRLVCSCSIFVSRTTIPLGHSMFVFVGNFPPNNSCTTEPDRKESIVNEIDNSGLYLWLALAISPVVILVYWYTHTNTHFEWIQRTANIFRC